MATTYHNELCGLCGNFNNDQKDDFTLSNGKAASNAKEFGISQWLASVPGCSHECKARVKVFSDVNKYSKYYGSIRIEKHGAKSATNWSLYNCKGN